MKRFPFPLTYPQETLGILFYVFKCLYFIQCSTSPSSINHPLLCAQFLMLFHLTDNILSVNHSSKYLSWETLMSVIRTS